MTVWHGGLALSCDRCDRMVAIAAKRRRDSSSVTDCRALHPEVSVYPLRMESPASLLPSAARHAPPPATLTARLRAEPRLHFFQSEFGTAQPLLFLGTKTTSVKEPQGNSALIDQHTSQKSSSSSPLQSSTFLAARPAFSLSSSCTLKTHPVLLVRSASGCVCVRACKVY